MRNAVVSRETRRGAHGLLTTDGRLVEAERVLLATGAYANAYGLAPRPLPLRIKTEVTIVARVAADDAEAYAGMPTLIYGLRESPLSDFYLVPPTDYPDGHRYLKAGADTSDDLILSTREEMNAWMRSGESESHHGAFRNVLGELLPDLALSETSTKRCLITYTAHGLPYIDEMEEGLFVAIGGNGRGAKSSDAIGAAAADLALEGWADPLPHAGFRLPDDADLRPEANPL